MHCPTSRCSVSLSITKQEQSGGATQRTNDTDKAEFKSGFVSSVKRAVIEALREEDEDAFDKYVQAQVEGHVLDHRPIMTIAGWG